MKKLFKASALFAILATSCLFAVSCGGKDTTNGSGPDNQTLQLGVGLSLIDNTPSSITVKVSLQKDAKGYYYAIGQATDLEAFKNGTLENIQTQSDPTVKEVTFDDLAENTQYMVFVQAFAGEEKGKVQTLAVSTTEQAREPDLNLTMELDNATENSFVMKIGYSKDAETIAYAYGTPDDLEAFEKGSLKTISRQEAKGSKTLIVSGLERGNDYTIFARAEAGGKKGNVVTASGRTYKLELRLELIKETLTTTSGQVKVYMSGDTKKYRYAMAPLAYKELFENGQWLETEWDTQEKILTVEHLKAGDSCTIMAQPFAENNASGITQVITFRTLTEENKE